MMTLANPPAGWMRTSLLVPWFFVFSLFANHAPCQMLDETWTVTVNGQSAQVNPDGTFLIPNVSSADQFGPGGPGTRPDFLSDDFLRLIGVRTVNGVTEYAFSERFQIQSGQVYRFQNITITQVPPPIVASLTTMPAAPIITAAESTQMTTTAELNDGSFQDVSRRQDWTIYRTSNPAIAAVGPDGLVTGQGPGTVFITAVNDGATAVARVTLTPAADPLTRVEGFVHLEDGTAFSSADVSIPAFSLSTMSGPDGRFAIDGVPSQLGPFFATANAMVPPSQNLFGSTKLLEPVQGGLTDAGIIVLRPGIQGVWVSRTPLPARRGALAAETISDKIYVAGGDLTWGGGAMSTRNDIYDPDVDSWSSGAPVPDTNTWGSGSAVVNGKMYLMGGWPGGDFLNRVYDPITDSWSYLTNIPISYSWGHTAAAVGDVIYVIDNNAGRRVFGYHVGTDTWDEKAPIPVGTRGRAAAVIGNMIFVVGQGSQLEIYNPITDSWSMGPALLSAAGAPSAAVSNGKLYVFGGSGPGVIHSEVQVFDPAVPSWSALANMPTPRYWSAAANFNNRIFVFGGFDSANNAVDPNEEVR